MTTTLTYFDFDASRGLECRLALSAAGVPFVDDRLGREQFGARRASLPFGALPVLTEGDRVLAQSTAILVYVGRTHGLHPADPWRAAQHEAVMLSVEDLRNKLPAGRDLDAAAKKAAREEFANGWLTRWADTVEGMITGPFFEGDTLHVVDIKLHVAVHAIVSGVYDHIPASTLDRHTRLRALHGAVGDHPRLQKWFHAAKERAARG